MGVARLHGLQQTAHLPPAAHAAIAAFLAVCTACEWSGPTGLDQCVEGGSRTISVMTRPWADIILVSQNVACPDPSAISPTRDAPISGAGIDDPVIIIVRRP